MDFPGHFQLLFKQLNHQRLHAQLCDCVVLVGGQSFQAHRSILAACSSHFRALLSSADSADEAGADTGGRGSPSVIELDPEVVTPEAFSTLLDMIYTSALSLRASNVMDVLLAASHLHLNAVVKACKLHLSRKNFPTSMPKGWRSVQQQQQQQQRHSQVEGSVMSVMSVREEDMDEERVGAEVSQSGSIEEQRHLSASHKRKSHEDRLSGIKKSCRPPEGNYKECSPTVTRSSVSTEELLSPDCLKTSNGLWEGRCEEEEETEEKYEAAKGESEEIQLPSQSDSGTGAKGEETAGDSVVKIKVGDEGEDDGEEPKMVMIEVKKENLSSYPADLDTVPNSSPSSPSKDSLDAQLNNEKLATTCTTEVDGSALHSQLCTDFNTEAQGDARGLCGESVDAEEGLDSLSELAFSCFLNPSSESVMGALDEEVSLASLTAAATAAAAASDSADAAAQKLECQNSEAQPSDSPSSLVFPVSSVPLQQLLPTQGSGFSETLILQPTQNPLTGFLSSIRPGLGLETSLVQTSRAGKSSGATTFRRIAPKVPPGSEAGADLSSPSVGDAADRPSLTRASEEVLSKCKKAAAEDHVLLVEGEKKYACKICCKTFMNLTDCKKHIRVHTGEKPYPCPKCGKRFSQSSHLYKHSKNTCLNWKDGQSLPDTLL